MGVLGSRLGKVEIRTFSLVELLVVVSVISVLLSMLMPSLQKTVYTAKLTQCKNNMKNIGIAFAVYTQDNHDFYPSFGSGHRGGTQNIAEFELLKPYHGSSSQMRSDYGCSMIIDELNSGSVAGIAPPPEFPFFRGNQTYSLWYNYRGNAGNSGILAEDMLTRVGDRWNPGVHAQSLSDKWFDILASDPLFTRAYGMPNRKGMGLSHIPFGYPEEAEVWRNSGHIAYTIPGWSEYNGNYLLTDGSVTHLDDLVPGVTLNGTYGVRLPNELAKDRE